MPSFYLTFSQAFRDRHGAYKLLCFCAAVLGLSLTLPAAHGAAMAFDDSRPDGVVLISWSGFENGMCVNGTCGVGGTSVADAGAPINFSGGWLSNGGASGYNPTYILDPGTSHIRNSLLVTFGIVDGTGTRPATMSGTFNTDYGKDLGTVPPNSRSVFATGASQDITGIAGAPANVSLYTTSKYFPASDVNWTVTNGAFSDGGSLAGSFVYNPGTGVMKSWSLSVNGGTVASFPAFTYTPQNSSYFTSAGVFLFDIPSANQAHRQLRIGPFDGPLLSSGGTVQFVPDSFGNLECINCAPYRSFTGGLSGTPVAVNTTLGTTGTASNPSGATAVTVNNTTAAAVNTASGNDYITFMDLIVPGKGLRFSFVRSYNDQDPYTGPLGRGWTHSYNILLTSDATGAVTIKEGDGHQNIFQPNGGGYTAPAGVYDVLVNTGANSFQLTRPNQTVLSFGPISSNSPIIRLLAITDKNSNKQTLAYDALGNLVSFTDIGGATYTFTYDTANHLLTLKDNGLNRKYSYNCDSTNLLSYTDSNSKISQYTYTNNLLTVATDAASNTAVNNNFDSQGRVTRTMRTVGTMTCTTTYSYDDVNHITTITDPYGSVTKHYHDTNQRLTKIVNALGFTTTFTYDSNNNLLSSTNPLGKTITYTYDARGNRTSVSDPLSNKTTFFYDSKNNLTKQTDANGNSSAFTYDARGNLATVTDALGGLTSFTYVAGNKVTFTNARQKTTNYTYDAGRHVLTSTDPSLNTTTSTYDSGGRLITVQEPVGNQKRIGYDALSRVTSVSYLPGILASIAPVSYTYDANGNRLTMSDGTGVTKYAYDSLNRLISVTLPGNRVVTYAYDCNDNRTSISYSGKTLKYGYDAINRLTSVIDGTNKTTYAYDSGNNLLSVTYPNGASVSYVYDAADRITHVSNTYTGSGGNPISSFSYVLDRVGNRTQITDGGGKVTSLTYDKLYRLTSDSAGKTNNYTYDPVGNRLSLTAPGLSVAYTYDSADKLMAAGNTMFHYDANGNQVRKSGSDGQGESDSQGPVTYKYDAADRLVSIQSGDDESSSGYAYDGDGNRISQRVGEGTYTYLNDISTGFTTVLDEVGPDGHIQYVRGRSLISAAGPQATYFYQYDAQSTVVGLTDTKGHLAERYVYNVWGQEQQAVPKPRVGTQNKFGYTGEALDPGSSLYYLRSRYYDPAIGRFISKDSFLGFDRSPQSLNRFSYVRNNPATLTDRTGFCDDDPDLEFFWPCAPELP